MAFFDTMKIEKQAQKANTSYENFGFPLKINAIESVSGGGYKISGVALTDVVQTKNGVATILKKAGEEMSVNMKENHYKWFLGHNLKRNLSMTDIGSADYYAGSTIVLSRCYVANEVILSQSAIVGTHCSPGRKASERTIDMDKLVSRPVIQIANNGKTIQIQMEKQALGTESVTTKMRSAANQPYENCQPSPILELAQGLKEIALEQKDILTRRQNPVDKNNIVKEDNLFSVYVITYSPKDSFVAQCANDIASKNTNIQMVASNGYTHRYFNSDDPAIQKKELDKAEEFITKNGSVEAIPSQLRYIDNDEAVVLTKAYGNYLENIDTNLSRQESWASHEKDLSSFNGLDSLLTSVHLVSTQWEDYKGNERTTLKYISLASSLPVTTFPLRLIQSTAPVVEAKPMAPAVKSPEIVVSQDFSGFENNDEIDIGMMDSAFMDAVFDNMPAPTAAPSRARPSAGLGL